MDNRTAKKASALLSSTGYLRLSSDLVPEKGSLVFILTPLPAEKRLVLKIVTDPVTGSCYYDHKAKRKALYANGASRCPLVAVKSAMKFLGIQLPKKSKEFPVKKRGDVLTVQF
jgi:hypothetical protein